MSVASTLISLALAAVTPPPGGHANGISGAAHAPKPVEYASNNDCIAFAAIAIQKMGWATKRSRFPLLTDIEEPKAIYRVNCPWAKLGVKAPQSATPKDPTVVMFLRPQWTVGGNVANVWTEGQQNRNSKAGPETWKEQFHVGKRNYGGGHIYWVVY
jgi:hypothetical protein